MISVQTIVLVLLHATIVIGIGVIGYWLVVDDDRPDERRKGCRHDAGRQGRADDSPMTGRPVGAARGRADRFS